MVQGIINDIPTVAELIERIIGEAIEIIGGRLAKAVARERG
jgi:nitronate monooxygenase